MYEYRIPVARRLVPFTCTHAFLLSIPVLVTQMLLTVAIRFHLAIRVTIPDRHRIVGYPWALVDLYYSSMRQFSLQEAHYYLS